MLPPADQAGAGLADEDAAADERSKQCQEHAAAAVHPARQGCAKVSTAAAAATNNSASCQVSATGTTRTCSGCIVVLHAHSHFTTEQTRCMDRTRQCIMRSHGSSFTVLAGMQKSTATRTHTHGTGCLVLSMLLLFAGCRSCPSPWASAQTQPQARHASCSPGAPTHM